MKCQTLLNTGLKDEGIHPKMTLPWSFAANIPTSGDHLKQGCLRFHFPFLQFAPTNNNRNLSSELKTLMEFV